MRRVSLRGAIAGLLGIGALIQVPRPACALFASTTTAFEQCDVMVFGGSCGPIGLAGIVERPDGSVLLGSFGDCSDMVLSFVLPATCPGSPAVPSVHPVSGFHCLAYGLDGRLYATRQFTEVIELDPDSGAMLRLVSPPSATWFGALGLAVDPRTGDLFTSAGTKVWRIAGAAGPTPVVSEFTDLSAFGAPLGLDGCAFSCEGSFLLTADRTGNRIFRVERNGTASVFVSFQTGTGPDGMCFGAPGTPLFGNAYANNNNGTVHEIPLANPAWSRTIASGSGLYGDFLTVSAAGDLLLTSGHKVTRLRSTAQGRFELPGAGLCANMECAAQADLNCIKQHGIRTSIRVAIPFICDPTNPPNARLARTCNSIDKIKKHAPGCTALLTAFRAMRDHLMTLASTPDCSGE